MSAEGIYHLNNIDYRDGANNILVKLTASVDTLTLVGNAAANVIIKGVSDPIANQDAATKNYVDNSTPDISWKSSVKVATTAGVNLSSSPSTIDGVTINDGDRVLVKNQDQTWTTQTNPGAGTDWKVIVWSEERSLFVAGKQSQAMSAYSSDGINWTSTNTAGVASWGQIVWAPESTYPGLTLTNAGTGYSTGAGQATTTSGSGSGLTINVLTTSSGPPGPIATFKVSSGGTGYVIGDTITVTTGGADATFTIDTFGIFLAVADNTLTAISTDGINWVSETSSSNANSVAWSPELGIFIWGANNGGHATLSSDGLTQTLYPSLGNQDWFSAAWSPSLDMFVMVSILGTNRLATSSDGVNWTTYAVPELAYHEIIWAPELEKFVAVASSTTTILYSTDGIEWVSITSALSNCRSIAWSSQLGILIAMTENATTNYQYSYDAINWTLSSTSFANSGDAVAWSPTLNIFAAVGANITTGTPADNGIYVENSGVLTRATDAIIGSSSAGVGVYVNNGVVNRQRLYFCTSPSGSTFGTNSVFVEFPRVPAGLDTQVQFNDEGVLAGSTKFVYDDSGGILTLNGTLKTNNIGGLYPWKTQVKIATTTTINLSVTPTLIDEVTVNNGDRVLVKNQGLTWLERTTPVATVDIAASTLTGVSDIAFLCVGGTAQTQTRSYDGITWTSFNISGIAPDRITWASTLPTMSINVAGSGYTTGSATITGGTGNDNMTINIDTIGGSGEITTFSLTFAGSGYTAGDILTVVKDGTGGQLIIDNMGLWCGHAGGTTSASYISVDTFSWTSHASAKNRIDDITWSPDLGLFCATGGITATSAIQTSPDGKSWTGRTVTGGYSFELDGVIWANSLNLFIAGSNDIDANTTRIITSPDGITWTTQSTPNVRVSRLAYSQELELIVTTGVTSGLTSRDGIIWVSHTQPLTCFDICWTQTTGLFVAVAGASYQYSQDGTTWITGTSSASGSTPIVWSDRYAFYVVPSTNNTKVFNGVFSENGIYELNSVTSLLTRTQDAAYGESSSGSTVYISDGTENRGKIYYSEVPSGTKFGTNAIFRPLNSRLAGSVNGTLQFNNYGALNGDPNFTFSTLSNTLTIGNNKFNSSTNTVEGIPSATLGSNFSLGAQTFEDTDTAASGTATAMVFNSIAQPTLNATNVTVTTTEAATLYIAGPPTAGTNETITRSLALWVNGDIKTNMSTGSGNTLGVDTNGILVDTVSLRKYKKDETPLNNSRTVLELQPKFFTWKDSNERDLGFIVEDALDAGLDQYVYIDSKVGPKNMKDRAIIAGLVGLAKEQNIRIGEQQKQIGEQQKQIGEQESRLKYLENKLENFLNKFK